VRRGSDGTHHIEESFAEQGRWLFTPVMANQHKGLPATRGPQQTAASTRWQESSRASSAQHHPHQQKRAGHLRVRSKCPARCLRAKSHWLKMPGPGQHQVHHPVRTVPTCRPAVLRRITEVAARPIGPGQG